MVTTPPNNELQKIQERYDRRKQLPATSLYSPVRPSVYMGEQEKERALIRWLQTSNLQPVQAKSVLEIGCGSGGNLLTLMKLGFNPENLTGNELLEDRAASARQRLPQVTQVLQGDAAQLDIPPASFDIIYQSTVFSSILNPEFQQKLADRMWQLAKPGGGILWYDFIYNNPKNSDVIGVPVKQIHKLFPQGKVTVWKVTLAPPISRLVTKVHPSLYTFVNLLPPLRTHVLCWIQK
jgi:ubiquinone/menaquinone biosynthesis C-methylase UbiE